MLELEPGANAEEIKKSFRRLALRYHPDTNQGNRHSEAWFRELQEAYDVLTDPIKKEAYLQERWLRKSAGKGFDEPVALTPEHILYKAQILAREVRGMDHFRMNHVALRRRIEELLQWQWLDMLQSFEDDKANDEILRLILQSCEPLEYRQIEQLKESFTTAEDMMPAWKQSLQAYISKRRNAYFWDQFQAPIIIGLSLLLCALIFAISSR